MGADAAKTYVASLLGHGEAVPEPQRHRCPSGAEDVMVFFETDPSYIVEGDVVSARRSIAHARSVGGQNYSYARCRRTRRIPRGAAHLGQRRKHREAPVRDSQSWKTAESPDGIMRIQSLVLFNRCSKTRRDSAGKGRRNPSFNGHKGTAGN